MSLTKDDYAVLANLLKHPALAGMGAIGREAAALAPKIDAEAATAATPAVVKHPTLKKIEDYIEHVFDESPEAKDNAP